MEYTIKEQEILNFKKRRYVRSLVAQAVAAGQLVKPNRCELCYVKCNTQSHHVDYGKPLRVIWLCKGCHTFVHTKGHHLNPNNNVQTPMPQLVQQHGSVCVSFTVPVSAFIAMQREAERQRKPIASIVREGALLQFKVTSNQLEFEFEEKVKNDNAQKIEQPRVRSLATNEKLLPKSKSTVLQKLRGKRHSGLQRMGQ